MIGATQLSTRECCVLPDKFDNSGEVKIRIETTKSACNRLKIVENPVNTPMDI